jgi:hypothetical protein
MSCNRYHRALTDHACGAALSDRAAAHLAGCRACQALLDRERGLVAGIEADLRRALDVSASPGFSAGVSARARAERTPSWHVPGAAWLAAAASVVIAVAVYAGLAVERHPAAPLTRQHDGRVVAESPPPGPETNLGEGERPVAAAPPAALARRAPREPRSRASAAPVSGAPSFEVIVPPTQLQAIARLWELAEGRALDEGTVPVGDTFTSPPADLVIAPLAVMEIVIPDVEVVTGAATALRAPDTSNKESL